MKNLTPSAILKQDAIIFFYDHSHIGMNAAHDIVNIDSTIFLRLAESQAVTYVLPQSENAGRAFLRLVEQVGERKEFSKVQDDRPMLASLDLDPGNHHMKFFLQCDIKPVNGIYELKFCFPECNIGVGSEQYSISIVVILPSYAQLISCDPPPCQEETRLESSLNNTTIALRRTVLSMQLQEDPILNIRYQYVTP
ncbi:hypothetical protein M3629_08825 [Paenibacillus polysaccharolyticus]|uniref:hypothetical protein n=1 Tax=Paenibacillus polysaccharolyticus TaxID=582692 RepID=UPI00203D673C|nr:hypothetical protein [Paenibacillus polysaccharolyticus]MCM3132887.1 hypothetical protein [Paenibacillus polysaccharolyticus]